MDIIDLRKIGQLTPLCELYLSRLIAETCENDFVKYEISLRAKKDFGWDNDHLISYVLAGVMTLSSCRVKGFLSSGEFLCGLFTSGKQLTLEHRIIMMSFVNDSVSCLMIGDNKYISGKKMWVDAPKPLKDVLDIIDDSIINNKVLSICVPKIIPLSPYKTIEELDDIPFEELKYKIIVEWE